MLREFGKHCCSAAKSRRLWKNCYAALAARLGAEHSCALLLAFLGHGYVDGVSGVVWDGAPSACSSYHLRCAVKDFLIPLTRVRVVPVDFSPQSFDLRLQLNDLRLELDDLQLQSIERSIRRR